MLANELQYFSELLLPSLPLWVSLSFFYRLSCIFVVDADIWYQVYDTELRSII